MINLFKRQMNSICLVMLIASTAMVVAEVPWFIKKPWNAGWSMAAAVKENSKSENTSLRNVAAAVAMGSFNRPRPKSMRITRWVARPFGALLLGYALLCPKEARVDFTEALAGFGDYLKSFQKLPNPEEELGDTRL